MPGITKRELSFLLTGKDVSASRAMRGVKKEVQSLSGIGAKAGRNLGKNIEKGLLLAGTALTGLVGYSVKAAGDFEAQLNTINTVAQQTPEALGAIGEGIRKVSRDTGTATDDLTAAYYDLVSAGISAADAQMVLENANKLAIGGLSTTGEAVDLLTTAINSYGGDASKAAQYTNMFAEAIGAGKVTAAELAASFAQVGPLAANAGIELKEVAAAIGVMTATGTQAPEAFTQIRSAMIALQRPTTALEKLQKKLRVNFAEMAAEKGLAFTYNEIAKAADEAGVPMIELTGRVEGANFAAQVAGDNYGKYATELERVEKSSEGAGVAQRQMEQRQKGLNYQLALLKANAHDAAITIGTEVIPELANLARDATTWLQGHQPEIKQFAKDLAGGIREAVSFARSFDWNAIGTSLQLAGAGAKTVLSMFLAMPSWVQAAVLTGWGLNKVTGGAVGDLIGLVGRSVVKGVLGMNAGVVNVKAGVVNAGGLGAGLGGGRGRGALGMTGVAGAAAGFGKALAITGAVAIVGEAIMLLLGILEEQSASNRQHEADIAAQGADFAKNASLPDLQRNLAGLKDQVAKWNSGWDPESLAFQLNIDGVRDATQGEIDRLAAEIRRRGADPNAAPVKPPSWLPQLLNAPRLLGEAISAARVNVRREAEAARGSRNRLEVVRGGGAAGAAVGADLVAAMQRGTGAWGQKLENQTRVLDAIKAAEQKALTTGDTVVAGKLAALRGQMTSLIAATKANKIKSGPGLQPGERGENRPGMGPGRARGGSWGITSGPGLQPGERGENRDTAKLLAATHETNTNVSGVRTAVNAQKDAVILVGARETASLDSVRATVGAEMASTRAKVGGELTSTRLTVVAGAARTAQASQGTTAAARTAGYVTASAVRSSGASIVAAIRGIHIPAPVISSTTINRTTNRTTRYGPQSGSRDAGPRAS